MISKVRFSWVMAVFVLLLGISHASQGSAKEQPQSQRELALSLLNTQGPALNNQQIADNAAPSVKKRKQKGSLKHSLQQKIGFWFLKKQLKKQKRAAKDVQEDGERKNHWGNVAGFGAAMLGLLDLILLGSGILLLVGGICGIVFGAMGMKHSGEGKEFKGKGLGIAGFVLGILEMVLVLMALVVVASFLSGF